ncbi:MAG: cupin domain-containing protein [Firmicutes bacterium]|nr:cupin domain-containing protein [Alicyclobacillaceae bacterium]MCL6497656.1 cupin domain-containing protein [Bacillota bacterium]
MGPKGRGRRATVREGAGPVKRVEKPWGYELWWAVTDRYAGKWIHVREGESLSLQYHRVKHESMLVLSGVAEVQIEDRVERLEAGQAVEIPPRTRHRLTAVTDVDVIEVSTPELDDVVRLEDRYGRVGS